MAEQTIARWAQEVFGHAQIEDRRWRARLVLMGAQAARRVGGRVTEVFLSSAERQGAYGLLESDAVSPEQTGLAVFEAAAKSSAEHEFVICPVDGTSLSLIDHQRSKDFGSIGSRAQQGRGLKVINALLLSPQGVPVGMGFQRWWVRPDKKANVHRDQREPQQKEIGRWLETMQGVRNGLRAHAPKTTCWFQLDREGDAWPLIEDAEKDGHWFTIRACRKRHVLLDDGSTEFLPAVLGRQPVVYTYRLEVRAGRQRAARTANMEVQACTVTLHLRNKRTNKRFPKQVNVVRAVERGTTPKGEKPIEWILLTNKSISTTPDLGQVIWGYSMRWRIEELHRTWKSGACRIEDTQLRSTSAVIKWATIQVAVAVRIERLKQLARQEPQRPATDEFSPLELRALTLLRFRKKAKSRLNSSAVPSIAEATQWLAEIGGYTGTKSSGGPPGSVTLARGLRELETAVATLEALGL